MEVEELKNKKKTLEKEINQLLIDFEKETGCFVDSIKIENIEFVGNGNELTTKLRSQLNVSFIW